MIKKDYFINLPMLDRFTTYHRKRLKTYARMLDAIRNAYASINGSREAAEIKIDEIAAILTGDDSYITDDSEYLMTNCFLNGLQCEIKGESMYYQGVAVRNNHELVNTFINHAAFDWCDLRKKFRNTNKSATEVFKKEILWDLPSANELYALLATEYAMAREILIAQPST